MEELRKLVKELEELSDEKEIIAKLQEIGTKLITDYEIKIKDLTIEPLLVEAYYCKKNIFCDCNCHQSPMQTNKADEERFGKIYQHTKTVTNGGIDICLPLGEKLGEKGYYLSYLIKVALINGEPYKQEGINKQILDLELKNDVQQMENVLQAKHKSLSTVCIPRKGTAKGEFAQAPLAVLAVDSFKKASQDRAVQGSLEKGYRKQWVLAKFGLEQNNHDKEKAREFIKSEELYKYRIENECMDGALDYIENCPWSK